MHHPHFGGLVVAAVIAIALLLYLGQISWWGAALLAVLVGVPAYLVSRQVYRALRRPASAGREALPGSRATVVSRVPEGGYFVRVAGELWRAESPDALVDGERVYVLDVDDHQLIVCRMPPELMSSV